MPGQSSKHSSLTPACDCNTSHPGKRCSPWYRDVSPGDRLFTKVPRPQDQADLIIVVMGVTGAGKSRFINEYLGKNVMAVNHGLNSCTQGIKCATITLPENHEKWPNRRVVLVDTPGFNDTHRGEWEILRKISVWLASVYDNDTKITGLVYLHNIGNTRVGGTALLSHDLFHRMCGVNAFNRVVMATTQWDPVSAHPGPEAERIREQELKKEFWAEILSQGACYKRIQNPQCDIRDIIEYILAKQFEAVATQIQEELVKLDKRVSQTKAGQKLIDTLQTRSGSRVPALAAQKLPPSKGPVRGDSSRHPHSPMPSDSRCGS